MSNNINLVQLSGNLGKALEFKAEVGNGLATFQLAHNCMVVRLHHRPRFLDKA